MEPEIKQYFRILVKRLWFISGMIILFCALTGIYDQLYSHPTYEANSKVIVNSSRGMDSLNSLDINEINSNILVIDTYKEIIGTPAIMEKVAAKLPELGLSANELISQIKVGSSSKSQIMSISFRSSSPVIAVNVVNTIAEVFKEEIPQIMSVDNVTILSKAKLSDHSAPVSPSLLYKLVIACILAVIVSVGIVFLWEYFDDTIKSERDISQFLGKPTLCTIARMKKSDLKTSSDQSRKNRVGDAVQVTINR
ncbi:YveK family protein [Cohnella silvisoli]|uniref:Wzz/FepE/Etk N-terminal domain-containing protein n=1 Tax=Cohnella silvisoli TaxID=2873699 RepID=A0ABV1KW10_9BACL|nr:Wzz/FepE/Etk N-terminal domain-containing protein [Cohnella silvisoli]MCD9023682.1 lipopolysaccharide biosynthesis protein [Cohnella silvisoli]